MALREIDREFRIDPQEDKQVTQDAAWILLEIVVEKNLYPLAREVAEEPSQVGGVLRVVQDGRPHVGSLAGSPEALSQGLAGILIQARCIEREHPFGRMAEDQ